MELIESQSLQLPHLEPDQQRKKVLTLQYRQSRAERLSLPVEERPRAQLIASAQALQVLEPSGRQQKSLYLD